MTQGNRESSLFLEGRGRDKWKIVRRGDRRLAKVLLKCLTLWSGVANTEVRWPGKGGIKGSEVSKRAKSLLSSCEEVENISRKKSVMCQERSEFEIEEKEKIQEGNGIKFGLLVEGLKRLNDCVDSNGSSCNTHL